MTKLACSTNLCKNKAEYYNNQEDSYYCTRWTYAMFNPKNLTKIGDVDVINLMIKIYLTLVKRVKDYVRKEQLNHKWKEALKQLNVFDDEVKWIKDELESILITERLKDLNSIQQRSINLKYKINNYLL